jgi:predicted SAM-dependent methyltransferase
MYRILQQLPYARDVWRAARKIRKQLYRRFGASHLQRKLAASPVKRIVIGAGFKTQPGWIPTQIEFLDLLKPADWARFFRPASIEAMLAEHVWEHLTLEEGREAARVCFEYLKHGGYLRIAVPDGFHPSPEYREWVRVGGASPMQVANDHKVLYTHETIRAVLEEAAFRVTLLEYFDSEGVFHYHDWDETAGKVWRSKRFDPRNAGGELVFTSIVLDAVKD